jgi:hypothetical protein
MKTGSGNSSSNEAISEVYREIIKTLDSRLNSQGYQIVHEQHDDNAFGSRYVIWSNNQDALRFTWDGKESVFVLEVADDLPLSSATAWDDITLVGYNPEKHDNAYVAAITRDILDSLN